MIYLLSTQVLLDIGHASHDPAHEWFLRKDTPESLDEFFISAFSTSIIRQHYLANPPQNQNEAVIRLNLEILFTRFDDGECILGVDQDIVEYWTQVFAIGSDPSMITSPNNQSCEIGFEEELVIATAGQGWNGLAPILVAKESQLFHTLNIPFEDPYI